MVTLEQFRYCPTHSTHPPFCYDFHYVEPGDALRILVTTAEQKASWHS